MIQPRPRPAAAPAAPPELPLPGIPKTRRVLVGVSGGVDSVALLNSLVQQGFCRIAVLHLNHGLRGSASDGDAAFVADLAHRLNLPLLTEKVDVAALATARKLSIETAARDARYSFFARAARKTRCRTVVLAHHADDQIETFLFNLLRGGGSGMAGMRPRSVREVDGVRLEILRPWLGVWRTDIEAYATGEKLTHREDSSNSSLLHTRNRIRRRVIPMLTEEFGRDVRQSLWRASEIVGAQQAWISRSLTVTGEELPVAVLRAMPDALQRHAVYEWLCRHCPSQVSFDLVERVRAVIPEGAATAKVNLPGGKFARRRAGRLFVESPRGPAAA